MKILITILLASIFAFIWMLEYEWSFNLWKIEVKEAHWVLDVDVSFIEKSVDYILYVPDILYNKNKDSIKEYVSKYFIIKDKDIFILIAFMYHLIFITFIYLITSIFPIKKDKRNLIILVIITYIILIYFISQ